MQFEYTARNPSGELVKGTIEADSESMAADLLLGKDFIVTKLSAVAASADYLKMAMEFFGRVNKKDLAVFLRQLSILISAAVPLVQALRLLSQQDMKKVLKDAVGDIVNQVEGGTKFSQALEQYPAIFTPYFISLIRSGESTGRLEETLNFLADQQERDYELQGKITGALMYPAFILGIMFIAGFVMMIFVLPKMLGMFTEMGAKESELPGTTQLLITLSYIASNYWWAVILGIVALVIGASVYSKTTDGAIVVDKLKMRVPVFGNLFRFIYIVRFTRSFRTILVGGITIPQGLRIVREVVGSPTFIALIDTAIREVEEGNPISGVFIKNPMIPSMVSQMIAVGEQTGRLDDVLDKITTFYSREIDLITENSLKLLEPLIMVLLGGAVAVMVSGILMPIMNLSSKV